MANLRLLLIILLCLVLLPFKSADTVITFIDVGQGDGIYINAGEDIMIDGGSSSTKKIGKYTLEPFLKSQRIGSIEKLFVSHADSDHTNGITYLTSDTNITVDDLYLPACARKDEHYDALIDAVCGRRESSYDGPISYAGAGADSSAGADSGTVTRIHYLQAGDVIPLKSGTITCMSPQSENIPDDMNKQSLILLYREGNFSALFTGDADKECELEMLEKIDEGRLPDIDHLTLLKVGHHGSNTSTSDTLLSTTSPLISILSYGQGNRYGHPHSETIDLLNEYHVRTLHTASSGAITLTTDGDTSIHISTFCNDN